MLFSDRKKVHYTFDDQTEMVEEYDANTNLLLSKSLECRHVVSHLANRTLVRKWHYKPSAGLKTGATADTWTFEIGQNFEVRPATENALGLMESTATVRRL